MRYHSIDVDEDGGAVHGVGDDDDDADHLVEVLARPDAVTECRPGEAPTQLRQSTAELTWFGDLCNSFILLVVSIVVVPSAPERLDVAHPGGRGQDSDVVDVHIVGKTAVNVEPAVYLSGVGVMNKTNVGGTVWSDCSCPVHDGRKEGEVK